MLQMTVLMVGKTREGFIQEGLDFYRKRLLPLVRLSLKSVREEKEAGGLTPETIKMKEGERLRAQMPPRAWVTALDPRRPGVYHRGIRRLAQQTARAGPAPGLSPRRPLGAGGRFVGCGRRTACLSPASP